MVSASPPAMTRFMLIGIAANIIMASMMCVFRLFLFWKGKSVKTYFSIVKMPVALLDLGTEKNCQKAEVIQGWGNA